MIQRSIVGAILCLILVGCGGTEPPPDFFQSKVTSPTGNDFPLGEVTVEEFVEKVQMTNGGYLKTSGWRRKAERYPPMLLDREDRLYVLEVKGVEDDIEVVFVHLLNKNQGGGAYSWALAVHPDGETLTGNDLVEYVRSQ